MAKLSKDEWFSINDKWSTDPKLTYSNLASEYGISRQAITLKAKKEGWKKTGNLATINLQAQKKANGLSSPNVDKKVDSVDRMLDLKESGFDSAVDLRVEIQVKHRDQIAELDRMQCSAKVLFDDALKTKKKDDFWMAKIAIDVCKDHAATTKLKQTMERKSWGMDETDLSPHDLESFTESEIDYFQSTGRLPMRFRKLFRSFCNDR